MPRQWSADFHASGTGLERYASRFDAVEINSTFYRSHRRETFQRWAETTPEGFRFSAKLPKTVTHVARLVDAMPLVEGFLSTASGLGAKLGQILVQGPPSLMFDAVVAERFFREFRDIWPGGIVCEPRHASWFEPEADDLLAAHRIGRVAADPAPDPRAGLPGGWRQVAYWRLHGSPAMYVSAYEAPALAALADALRACEAPEAWCVFDNTARGAAAGNGLQLMDLLVGKGAGRDLDAVGREGADCRQQASP